MESYCTCDGGQCGKWKTGFTPSQRLHAGANLGPQFWNQDWPPADNIILGRMVRMVVIVFENA